MENNVIKENYFDVINNREITAIAKSEILPTIRMDRNLLLPAVIPYRELSMVEVKQKFNTLKQDRAWTSVIRFAKILFKFFAKTARLFFLLITSIAAFIGVSTLIVASIAIITKNIVNSFYDVKPQDEDYTYSIFQVKDQELK